jgi:two-component sensor histidine kinase
MDVTARKKWEEHQQLLIHELNHRVKNTLATVQSITSQTLRNSTTSRDARDAIEARLFALSRAHDVLTRENWEGAGLKEIVTEAMAPYRNDHENRLHARGPDVRLSTRTALALAMALQELATNAVKYGALSNATGQIHIDWMIERRADGTRLRLTWTERGGPRVEPPSRRGFGTRLIERSLAQDLSGEVKIDFHPQGVICTVDAPLS